MRVKEIMTHHPTCCFVDTKLNEVAKMMLEHDCGEIPVVDYKRHPLGVVTDRDIVCRGIAQGKDPWMAAAHDVMTTPCITVHPATTLEECCKILETHKIRRVPVVNEKGACVGMVSQADLATHHLGSELVEVVEEVSKHAI